MTFLNQMEKPKQSFSGRMIAIIMFVILLAFATGGLIGALGFSARPRIIGILIFGISLGVAIWTIKIWARILPAILSCAALNGLVMAFRGTLINDSSVPVSRVLALTAAVAMLIAAFFATSFRRNALGTVDQFSAAGIFVSMILAFPPMNYQIAAFAGTLSFAALSWGLHRYSRDSRGRTSELHHR